MNSALVMTERKGQILSLLYQDNRLMKVKVHEERLPERNDADSDFCPVVDEENGRNTLALVLGAVYIGKVKNVVPALEAAFVEVKKDIMGFLPLKNAQNPVITNREYDGRILAGDEILVQVEKEAVKTKDAGLTCNLSFSGKYLVLTTGNIKLGFSSKLSAEIKEQWKQIIGNGKYEDILRRENVGMVIRTNVSGLLTSTESFESEEKKESGLAGEKCFKEEFEYLLALKARILKEASYRVCFSCLFSPMESYLTDIRDSYDTSFDKIITDNAFIYQRIREAFPDMEKVELYQDSRISLSKLYSVETRLKEALDERVWLKSGAYLVIQQTEALTVIDVNSGKIQKKHPRDDIYYSINKEAAEEIARQLTLRNLSGIIVIDFISQNTKEQDEQLLIFLKRLVKKDSIKTNVIDMTPLGLVEVTRKKVHKSLREQIKQNGK